MTGRSAWDSRAGDSQVRVWYRDARRQRHRHGRLRRHLQPRQPGHRERPQRRRALTRGVPTTITWSSPAYTGGQFGVWAVERSSGSWYWLGAKAVTAGHTTDSLDWTPALPVGSYEVCVGYASTGTNWSYSSTTRTPASAWTSGTTLTVTAPNGGETLTRGVPTTITCSSPAYTGGQFGVWAVERSSGSWYWLGAKAVTAGHTTDSLDWTPALPVGSYEVWRRVRSHGHGLDAARLLGSPSA